MDTGGLWVNGLRFMISIIARGVVQAPSKVEMPQHPWFSQLQQPEIAANPGEKVITAYKGEELAGHLSIIEGQRTITIAKIYTEPQFRNQGIGKELLDRALEYSASKGKVLLSGSLSGPGTEHITGLEKSGHIRTHMPTPSEMADQEFRKTMLVIEPAKQTHQSTQTSASPIVLANTQETTEELRRRLGKELYRMELDLQNGGRIAGKPCDCLSKKHHLGIEATAEELMSYEHKPVYGEVINWLNDHAPEFEPTAIIKHDPDYYRALLPKVRAFRKEVMGTEHVTALLSPSQQERVKVKLAEISQEVTK